MRKFLQSYLKEGEQFKASTACLEFLKSGQAKDPSGRVISQKDFAMYLRTEVLKRDGLLKRTAHGIYEKRLDAEDQGVTFTRRAQQFNGGPDVYDAYLDSLHITDDDAQMDKIYEDTVLLTARIRRAMRTLQQICEVYPEYTVELASYYAGLMKDMDRIATGVSAMMAWCDDHSEELVVAQEVKQYLKSDDFRHDFTAAMFSTTDPADSIRKRLIQEQRIQLEEVAIGGAQGQGISDPEDGISDTGSQSCGESMTLSW